MLMLGVSRYGIASARFGTRANVLGAGARIARDPAASPTRNQGMIEARYAYNASSGDAFPGEFTLRYLAALLVVSGTLAISGPALSRDIHLHKMDATVLKQTCDKAGGRFSQGPKRYGCGTDCHGGPGTDCTVTCEPGRRCIAQVMGARRPRTIEQALQAQAKYPR